MVELYTSWCKGLAQSKQALDILKACPFITGIETLNSGGELGLFQKAGLKVSVHNPIKMINCGLNDGRLVSELKKKKNAYVLDSVRKADAGTAGFHAYNKMLPVELHVMKNKPLPEGIFEKESLEQIRNNIVKNLVFLEREINKNNSNYNRKLNGKKILFETQPYTNFSKLKNSANKIGEREMMILRKAGMMSTPKFLASILNNKQIKGNNNMGFLFDISHVFISVKTMIENKELNEELEAYIKKVIDASKGSVYQLHIACPTTLAKGVYVDDQAELKKGECMSKQVLSIAKQVLQANPGVVSIALEIDTHLNPVAHAKKLVEQAEMVANELGLKVEK